MNKVNLETFSTYNFNKGANKLKIVIWYLSTPYLSALLGIPLWE